MRIVAHRALVFAVLLLWLSPCGACSSWRTNVRWAPRTVASTVRQLSPAAEAAAANPSSVPKRARPESESEALDQRPERFSSGLTPAIGQIPDVLPEPGQRPWERVYREYQEEQFKFWTDCRHYYSRRGLRDLFLGIGGASILANTSLDQDFQDWYQEDVRSSGLDRCADFVRPFGDGWYVIPVCVGFGVVGTMNEETAWGGTLQEFGGRAARAYGVGAPPMVFLQYALGGSRPDEEAHHSRWRPFEDSNGVSGHAFVGAVPFITAAKMSEDPCLKGTFYFCSLLTGWARVNDDRHYLSQAVLGWWMAYLACEAVDRTEGDDGPFRFTPVAMADGLAIGLVYER